MFNEANDERFGEAECGARNGNTEITWSIFSVF